MKVNTDMSEKWPNITQMKDPPPDHKEWDGKPNKRELLSEEPGEGDL
jgi:ferredoxin